MAVEEGELVSYDFYPFIQIDVDINPGVWIYWCKIKKMEQKSTNKQKVISLYLKVSTRGKPLAKICQVRIYLLHHGAGEQSSSI